LILVADDYEKSARCELGLEREEDWWFGNGMGFKVIVNKQKCEIQIYGSHI